MITGFQFENLNVGLANELTQTFSIFPVFGSLLPVSYSLLYVHPQKVVLDVSTVVQLLPLSKINPPSSDIVEYIHSTHSSILETLTSL